LQAFTVYCGFVGVTAVWQLLFLYIAGDPVRHRPLMLFGIAEKLSLVPAFVILQTQARRSDLWTIPFFIDLLLAVLFWISHKKPLRKLSKRLFLKEPLYAHLECCG
jgi:hypothetical protein